MSYDREFKDFINDFSEGSELWNHVFLNIDTDAQLAFWRRLAENPAQAQTWMHNAATDYLVAYIDKRGLETAREAWG